MRLRVAENLGILSSDGATVVEGLVTIDGINNRLNDVYREEIFPLFSDKFPDDFAQETYPFPTYTSSGAVDGASTGATLVATTGIFDNSMEGFYVYNANAQAKQKILTYTSSTTVTLDGSVTWTAGDTIYVLGNEYTFGGDVTDIKEIVQVQIKFASTDKDWRTAVLGDIKELTSIGNEVYAKAAPRFYRTMIDVAGKPYPAVGILPYPEDYQGKIQIRYIERPPALGDSDEPTLTIPGIAEVLIYGATAWGFRLQRKWDDAQYYQALYEDYKRKLVGSYKPRSRAGARQLLPSKQAFLIRQRSV